MNNGVSDGCEMCCIFIFFGKDISDVLGAFAMENSNGFVTNRFSNSIFSHLDVSEAFGCETSRPVDTTHVIVVNVGGDVDEFFHIEVVKDMFNVEEFFGAFVSSIDFSFTRTSGCYFASIR